VVVTNPHKLCLDGAFGALEPVSEVNDEVKEEFFVVALFLRVSSPEEGVAFPRFAKPSPPNPRANIPYPRAFREL
jgi:hypothetical protein